MEELSHRIAAKEPEPPECRWQIRPSSVTGDATRLRQVISNLLDNAIKYRPRADRSDSRLTSDATARCSESATPAWASLPDRLTAIFEPFVQHPQGLARTDGGLGLGLSLVKRIVELHGGTVQAESRWNRRGR